MEEDVLSDVVPSNIVSRQVGILFPNYRVPASGLISHHQESEGVESEYAGDVDQSEGVDELQSDEDTEVCSSQHWPQGFYLPIADIAIYQPSRDPQSPAKLSKIQASAERQQKKQKRKAEEGVLHARRQEMDKAKVHHFLPSCGLSIQLKHIAIGCCQTLLLSSWTNRTLQTFCRYQSMCTNQTSCSFSDTYQINRKHATLSTLLC